eukprot:scaffold7994_cov286-Pinguiococcus_pyrenoidosus.AAC.1
MAQEVRRIFCSVALHSNMPPQYASSRPRLEHPAHAPCGHYNQGWGSESPKRSRTWGAPLQCPSPRTRRNAKAPRSGHRGSAEGSKAAPDAGRQKRQRRGAQRRRQGGAPHGFRGRS